MRPPESWTTARLTLILAGVTALAWMVTAVLQAGDAMALWGGFIPERINGAADGGAPVWLTPLTATLVHAGLIHLVFNLLILLVCGRAIEPIVGSAGLLILYVVGAYAAAAGQYFLHIQEAAPMVGASGAISAVLGAYALLFGRNRVKIANPRLAELIHALWLGAAWVFLQLLTGITFETIGARLAVGAHIGGFFAGMLLARPLLLFRYRNA